MDGLSRASARGPGGHDQDATLSWSVRQRLEFIEFRLFWDERVNRGDLVDRFGISVPQASADFANYAKLAPGNIRYDAIEKTYVPGSGFELRLYRLSPDRILLQFQALVDGLITRLDTSFGFIPTLAVVPSLSRQVSARCLRKVLHAIRDKRAIEITYQSLSHETPGVRAIIPYALAFDGFRWHTRAWCTKRHAFRDFVLARILDIGESRRARIDPSYDLEWHTPFKLKIAPHPNLPATQRNAIAVEYGMTDGVLEFDTTVYLAWYLMHRLLLDVDTDRLPPERVQIHLLNKQELMAAQAQTAAAVQATARAAIAEQF